MIFVKYFNSPAVLIQLVVLKFCKFSDWILEAVSIKVPPGYIATPCLVQSFDFFLPVTLATSSPDNRKSGYFMSPPVPEPEDMRQLAPSTARMLVNSFLYLAMHTQHTD